MAQSPAHRFGQIIGELLEAAVLPRLVEFAARHQLFLDRHGSRACRPGKKCSWTDAHGNRHDLDFVLERNGTEEKLGVPVAFIETAWRRYTKHSRNKAQEIQGAIEPLANTFRHSSPFKGAILAGVFTAGELAQLRSLGFVVLYIPYESIVRAFQNFRIDARFNEQTPDADYEPKIAAYESLSPKRRQRLAESLLAAHQAEAEEFFAALTHAVTGRIERVVVTAWHGSSFELNSLDEAVRCLQSYQFTANSLCQQRYEIEVRYTNGNSITGLFHDVASAVRFLRTHAA